jgi:predicted esterase
MNTSAQAFGYVHRYLPPSGDDPRTLLLLHGTGGDENDLIPLGQMLAPDAGSVSILGINPRTNPLAVPGVWPRACLAG